MNITGDNNAQFSGEHLSFIICHALAIFLYFAWAESLWTVSFLLNSFLAKPLKYHALLYRFRIPYLLSSRPTRQN